MLSGVIYVLMYLQSDLEYEFVINLVWFNRLLGDVLSTVIVYLDYNCELCQYCDSYFLCSML